MSDMKVLVTGAAGMLASDLCPELERHDVEVIRTDIDLTDASIRKMDITVPEEVAEVVDEHAPDWIFHLAAETDVDLCEKDPDHAFRVNTLGTENIVFACRERGIPLVYISTAAVFGGTKQEPYTEYDTPDPSNAYAHSKLEGEKAVTTFLDRFFIFRAGWMVGGWTIDKKFVYKIATLLGEQDRITVVDDKFGSPTFTFDFSRNLVRVWKTGRYGLYHLANRGVTSRIEMARHIAKYMGVADRVEIVPINSAHFPLPAPRGRSEMMRNYRLDLLGWNDMPRWEESLERYIRENTGNADDD
jgi:dTDP-4-dehydrorhamnose reductase